MKKINNINLHKLSQAELAAKEQAMLVGGCGCISICAGSICACAEDSSSGGFPSSDGNVEASGIIDEIGNDASATLLAQL